VLRRIFGPKRERLAGGWIRLHNEERHTLYVSRNVRVVTSKRMRLARYVARMRAEKCVQNFGPET
jgi:hypothetical protein